MKLLCILTASVILAFNLPVYGQEKSSQPSPNTTHPENHKEPTLQATPSVPTVQVNVVNHEASNKQEDWSQRNADSYFGRLFSPENLPNIGLTLVGIAAIIVAIRTLRVIRRQTEATEIAAKAAKDSADGFVNSERAWVIVEEGHLFQVPSGKHIIRPTIKNFGKTIARIRKVQLGGHTIQIGKEFVEPPVYSISETFDFVLCPEQEFLSSESTSIPIGNDDLANVRTELFTLYVFGLIEYLDLAGKERTTGFVLVFDPPRFLPYLKAPSAYYKTT